VIGDECRILGIAEVVEAGSQRGKENAAAALLQLWHGGFRLLRDSYICLRDSCNNTYMVAYHSRL
jgi:hypothetical protein